MVLGYEDPFDICTFYILKIVRIIKLILLALKHTTQKYRLKRNNVTFMA